MWKKEYVINLLHFVFPYFNFIELPDIIRISRLGGIFLYKNKPWVLISNQEFLDFKAFGRSHFCFRITISTNFAGCFLFYNRIGCASNYLMESSWKNHISDFSPTGKVLGDSNLKWIFYQIRCSKRIFVFLIYIFHPQQLGL